MSNRFTPLFKQAIGNYVSYVQLVLELQDWRITLLAAYPDGDAAASMKCVYGQRLGELALCRDFFEFEPDRQRHYIVHELTHILTDGCDNVIENGLDEILGKPAWVVLREAWRVQVEYLTDQLTYVIVDLMTEIPRHDRLWENVLRAERDELPLPDPATGVELAAP
jgi:hypothetical protein